MSEVTRYVLRIYYRGMKGEWNRYGRARNLTSSLRATILACSKAGLLILARADLVCMMDADTVAASLLETDGATYHFVCVPPFASAPTAAAPAAAVLTRAELLAARGCRAIGTHR